ncbi:PecA family PE domain-processing aspartic protease [Mycolicibacterium sp. 141076]|uniref:PecA family PE domain-processing aspartic protease n=1 Tax=Mycobacteriaceae TaxID=1762 RepID=UPI00299E345B|nr:PecA family PE domain-processing aspartic protease [Mycolicibacterium sp. 141076]MDX1876471.1 PecA family PE domain-processing aspartic protease [Mycolicibacterium sp. 141076]
MAGAHRRPQRRNLAVSTWLGTGVAAVGVSAALLGSAAVASAAPSTDSESASSSAPAQPKKAPAQKTTKNKKKDAAAAADAPDTKAASDSKPASDTKSASATDSSAGAATDSDNDAKPTRNRRAKSDDNGRSASAPNAGTVAKLPTTAAQAVTKNPSTKNPLKAAAAVKPATDTATNDAPSSASAPVAATPAAAPAPVAASTPQVTVAAAETSTAAITSVPNTTVKALSSATSPTAPANISGLLSVLAAVGQALGAATLATEESLAGAVVGTTKTVSKLLGITPALATTTEKTSAAATLTPAPTETWQPGQTVTADEYINTALAEIAQARTLLGTSWVNGYSRYELRMAATYLTTYQANQQTLMDAYAANPTTTNLTALKANEALIGKSVTALKTARYWSANRDIKAIIVDATTNARIYASVPLSMYAGVEPIVTISVNGGPSIKVLVDTGSSGLVVNAKNVGQTGLGNSVGTGTGAYSGGLTYTYNTYNTTVNFGNGIVTAPVPVDIITDPAQQTAFANFLKYNGVVGVLGVGTNAVGPGPGLVTTGLPGALKNGIYIDEAGKTLTFGPNPLPARVTTSGSPNVIGSVSINNGSKTPINLLIDSGGVTGTLPSTIMGSTIPVGTVISVYDSNGVLLYTYTTTSSYTPVVTSDAYNAELMNTGAMPFLHNRIYIDYSTANGSTVFDL